MPKRIKCVYFCSGACAGESISDCKKTLPPPFGSRSSQCAIHLSDFIIFLKNKTHDISGESLVGIQ